MLSLLCQAAGSPPRVLVDTRRRRLWELTGIFPRALGAGAQQASVLRQSTVVTAAQGGATHVPVNRNGPSAQ